ncbi:MAG: alpha-mannosidase, partial [Bacteroidales bacterium]|nr:alpha-mannosidase [Bacteroidales bacterium]
MKNSNKNPGNNLPRRTFLAMIASGTASVLFMPAGELAGLQGRLTSKWPSGASKLRIHMIGNAHIDPVWLWPWPEGMAVVHSTFRSALDRMKETPDFTFTASSAQFYQWVAENDPEMLSEIKQMVEQGRWNIAGGWWVEPDVNIPGGEALVRQGLYGQLTLKKLLGRKADTGFNPDSFGHANTLPQILKLQGLNNYVFMRPMQNEKSLPSNLFWWEGPDGTRILTYRIPVSYVDRGDVRTRIEQVISQLKDYPAKSFMVYFGAGDHGGGATKENISSIQLLQSEKGAPAVFFSTPSDFFKEVRKDSDLSLPVVSDELQHHAVGCYTAEAEIKKKNRLSETMLVTAEKITAVGSVVWGCNYPMDEFTNAWKRVLFLQFHDSLAGTSVPGHSKTAEEGFGAAIDAANQAIYKSVQKLEWQVPALDPQSQYLLAFNPHPWATVSNLEYDFNWDIKNPSLVIDESGNPLQHQWTTAGTETGTRKGLIIRTSLPAFGYRQVRLKMDNPPDFIHTVRSANDIMENDFLKISFSKDGTTSIYDKETEMELFAGGATGCRAIVINDPSDTWSHDVKSFEDEAGMFGNAVVKTLESGPLRAIVRVISTYGTSTLTIDWILYAGLRSVEARINLNWNEKLKMLKFSFPANLVSPEITNETPYGFINRKANGNEESGQRWIDITGFNNDVKRGFTIINDAKYGYSVKENDVRITVIRSAVYAHHVPRVLDMNSEHLWMDQGIHTFRLMLIPHLDSWMESEIPRRTEEFMTPPVLIYQGIHGGIMPGSGDFLSVTPANVIVTAIKKAEDGSNDIIFRCVETSGRKTTGLINMKFADLK